MKHLSQCLLLVFFSTSLLANNHGHGIPPAPRVTQGFQYTIVDRAHALNPVRPEIFQDGLVVDHEAVARFDEIPESAIKTAAALRLMFRHASVGSTIDDGLDCLQGTRAHPSECAQYPAYKYDRRNWDFQQRGNSGWYGKVDGFVAETERQLASFDVFSFKYCYLDGLDELKQPCGNPYDPAQVDKAWSYLRDKMEHLEAAHPDKPFIWWTIPLTQSGQVCADTLNARIRGYARERGKILFDIADIECHDPNGVRQTNSNGVEVAYPPYCGEQKPGARACHPNWTGKILLAKAFWWMMSRVAGGSVSAMERPLPAEDAVVQAFPNPFRDATTITFTLRRSTPVNLAIHDVLGRVARTVIDNAAYRPGDHRVRFDATGLVPGVYFCRFRTREHNIVRMLVLR